MAALKKSTVELVIQGLTDQSLRHEFIEGQTVRLGRSPAHGCAVAWDRTISREHADLLWQNGRLYVTCLVAAMNPIKYRGAATRSAVVFGSEVFEIGQTRFYVDGGPVSASNFPSPSSPTSRETIAGRSQSTAEQEFLTKDDDDDEFLEEHTFPSIELKNVSFGDAERQMEVLSNLPQLISGSTSDVDLAEMLCGLLLDAIPPAIAVAAALFEESDVLEMQNRDDPDAPIPKPKLMRVQTREDYEGRFAPSRRLLRKAIRRRENVMYIASEGGASKFTMANSLAWAFCAPLTTESCVGWCLYVSGLGGRDDNNLVTADSLKGDLRFTQLVAQFIGSIRTVRALQEQQTQLSAFFSPKVMENLTKKGGAGDVLVPSERDISVLFCDVRGFSRQAEQLKNDLHNLLDCVKAALSAMTGGMLAFDGSIADFQGDAALGFWGWPTPLPDGPMSTCRAALAIMRAFHLPPEQQGLLKGFSCGAGIAHGRAIAGQIGTTQQAKIGVFGPVVNQGSRIEGLTRQFGISICIDEATADFVRRLMPPEEGRCRRLACVYPKGMDTSLLLYELLPPEADGTSVDDLGMLNYGAAVDLVISGRWAEAIERLNAVPDEDGPKKFLLTQMAKFDYAPPADWDGAFRLDTK